MSWIGTAGEGKSGVDIALAAAAGTVLVSLVGIGLYGTFTGFVQTVGYWKANDLVALLVGFIGGGCALYLLLEWASGTQGRMVFALCIVAGVFSVFAVTKGLPAAVTSASGHEGSAVFEIVRYEGGGRSCSRTVVATNPGYEDFRMCITGFSGRRPDIGRHVEVHGMMSSWGIVRSEYRVMP
jgi:hypothetical protein